MYFYYENKIVFKLKCIDVNFFVVSTAIFFRKCHALLFLSFDNYSSKYSGN